MNRNLKTILTGGGILILVGFIIFVYFQFIAAPASKTSSPQKIVTKAQNKTYLKYVALNNQEPTISPLPTSVQATPTPTDAASGVTPTEMSTPSPSPTEIIVALSTPTSSASSEAQTTTEPTAIAQLPTTGLIGGSIVIFLIAASMIVFAFVL